MALDIMRERGTPLAEQRFTWKDIVQAPISKLDDDAFTRVRVILMNGIESESLRFSHACARMNRDLQLDLARVRRVEQFQQTAINWLLPGDQSQLETTIGFEQVAIEITAAVAMQEADPYLRQVYHFGLLEDFDHLYRYAALLDRVDGKDANNILQCYTDIRPGRATMFHHRAPEDDLRRPYDKATASPLSKLHAGTIMAAEHQTHDYYMNVGPSFSDPAARLLYAEIAAVEEQHVTQYESIIDPTETWIEKWLMHEATEVWNYLACVEQESNPRIKRVWERFLDYELGQLHHVMGVMKRVERRDPAELLPAELPDPIPHASQRAYVREVLARETELRANGAEIVPREQESRASIEYRQRLHAEGCPSESVAAGYQWSPGTELGVRVNGDGTRRQREARA